MGSQIAVALVLGLTGSLGHCFGMCGGISLMLGSATPGSRRVEPRVVVASLGRITTYTFLGASAGLVGEALSGAVPGMSVLQGVLALLAGAFAVYTALALLGRVPQPDRLLTGLTGGWGRAMQASMNRSAGVPYLTGLVWEFLPCGLVLVALVGAAATGSPLQGATVMLAFGLGTVPAVVGVGALGHLLKRKAGDRRPTNWAVVAAGVVGVFGLQMALRGLAAWGIVDHVTIGEFVLW